jgi:hypothetical protein
MRLLAAAFMIALTGCTSAQTHPPREAVSVGDSTKDGRTVQVPRPQALVVATELPFFEKVQRARIIFLGEIIDVAWDYPNRVSPKPLRPSEGTRLLGVIKAIRILKAPADFSTGATFYAPIAGDIIDKPAGLAVWTSWSATNAFYIGKRFVFFAHDATELGPKTFELGIGYSIKPEPADREQEVRDLLEAATHSK